MDEGERSVFFEILGSDLETFCFEDQFEVHRKCKSSLKGSKDINAKVKVYSEIEGGLIYASKGEVQIVDL